MVYRGQICVHLYLCVCAQVYMFALLSSGLVPWLLLFTGASNVRCMDLLVLECVCVCVCVRVCNCVCVCHSVIVVAVRYK